MASKQERAALLRRYYSEHTTRTLMLGTARSGLAGTQNRLEYDSQWPRLTGRLRARNRALIQEVRRRRRRGETVLLDREQTQLVIRLAKEAKCSAATFVEFWNKSTGFDQFVVLGGHTTAPEDRASHVQQTRNVAVASAIHDEVVLAWVWSARRYDWVQAWVRREDVFGLLPTNSDDFRYFLPPGRYAGGHGVSIRMYCDSLRTGSTTEKAIYQPKGSLLEKLGMCLYTDADLYELMGSQCQDQGLDPVVLHGSGGDGSSQFICAPEHLGSVARLRLGNNLRDRLPVERAHYHQSRGMIVGSAEGSGRYTLGMEWEVEPVPCDRADEWLRGKEYVERLCPGIIGDTLATSLHMVVGAMRKAAGIASYVHAERDSTIEAGYELVFAYRTLDRHQQTIERAMTLDDEHPWMDTLCSACNGGIHVHIGRKRTDGTRMSAQFITAMANFVHYAHNDAFITALAGRAIGTSRYVRRPSSDGLLGIRHGDMSSQLSDHYLAVNARDTTVELRIFDSTGNPGDLLRALEFTEALAHYVETLEDDGARFFYRSFSKLDWRQLREFVLANALSGRWPRLCVWMDSDKVRHLVAEHRDLSDAVEVAVADDDDSIDALLDTYTITSTTGVNPFLAALNATVLTGTEHRALLDRVQRSIDETSEAVRAGGI